VAATTSCLFDKDIIRKRLVIDQNCYCNTYNGNLKPATDWRYQIRSVASPSGRNLFRQIEKKFQNNIYTKRCYAIDWDIRVAPRRHLVRIAISGRMKCENQYMMGRKTANNNLTKTQLSSKWWCYGQSSLENRKQSGIS
jgi:hypothetical protein